MTLTQKNTEDIINAMRAKDTTRLMALRNLKAAFSNEMVALKRASTETLTDNEAGAVIRRLAKQRKDSILQFKKGGREELARAEETELKILESYLPQLMNETEIKKIAKTKQKELGITDKSKAGSFMKEMMKELKGKADGAVVKKVVDELFQ